jgi:hypothetical protein
VLVKALVFGRDDSACQPAVVVKFAGALAARRARGGKRFGAQTADLKALDLRRHLQLAIRQRQARLQRKAALDAGLRNFRNGRGKERVAIGNRRHR